MRIANKLANQIKNKIMNNKNNHSNDSERIKDKKLNKNASDSNINSDSVITPSKPSADKGKKFIRSKLESVV